MNLAFAVHYYDRAEGTGGYVVELVERFARRHDVTVYAVAVRTPLPPTVRFVPVPALRGSAYATVLSYPAAFAAVRGRHDVVHAQGWVTGHADIVTAHIVLGAWREAAHRWGTRSAFGERFLGGVVSRREGALLRLGARRVIVPSERARADVARFARREHGVAVVRHGFDRRLTPTPRAEARATLGLSSDVPLALYAGDPRKGLKAVLDALREVPTLRLLVLSSAPARGPWGRLEPAMRRRVTWAPQGTPAANAFGAADFLVHPTIYDTFGLVVAEAMAAGLPVIVSKEAGVAECLTHGASALLLASPDAESTADAMRRLSADETLRTRLSDGGRAVAAGRSWDDVVDETEALYREVM